MTRTPPEEWMAAALDRLGFVYEEQGLFAGHRIDFLVQSARGEVCLDANGDRWHRWKKIVDCDRLKLDRVLFAGGLPCGIWWSRMQKDPARAEAMIVAAVKEGILLEWDWAVKPETLAPVARQAMEAVFRGSL